ncbi:MAG: DUF2690 domain-containing protein [Anaerolineales bacterium]|nr:DUF2690 domain-containing protein [Anaerolineales bacterium]MBX3038866.1 DUF2690 domain-containing protein [Anaerolineales bacterium]
MRNVKIGLTVMMAIMIAVVSSFPFAGVAHALCSGSACNGTDPLATGCSAGAATVRQKWPYGNPGPLKIELRFSDTCTTFWARSWNFSAFSYYINATLKNWYWHQRYSPPSDSTYSAQRYGSNGFQACGDFSTSPITSPVTSPSWKCTSTY